MAESVVKLRVESSEYDAKIRRAADGVRAFGENCRKAGESVTKADKDTLDYVRAIGQMETVSKNAKGKVNEMTSAFTELSVQYKQLSDQEKQSPFGKALAQSLDELKTRINDSKAQLAEVNTELGNTSTQSDATGGVLDALAGKFGLNVTQAGALGVALGAATIATKVAKDAFFANEQQLDEWGRVVTSSESVYRGFLNALNNGDISGFLSKISTIVQAARDAYNALDELATYNAFNQINVERTRFALSESINNFREGTGSKENVQNAGNAVIKELRTRQQKEREAYVAAVGKLAAERGVNKNDLLDALSGNYGNYTELKNTKPTGSRTVYYGGGMLFGGGGSYQVATPQNQRERLGQALRKINDTELQNLQALGAQAERTGIEIEGVNRQIIRTMNARSGGGGGGGRAGGSTGGGGRVGGGRNGGGVTNPPPPEGSIAAQEAKVQALTKAWRNATDEAGRAGYLGQLEEAKALLDEMQGKTKEVIPEGSLKDLNNQMQELQKQRELLADPIDISILDDDIQRIKDKIDELNGVVKKDTTSTPMSLEDKIRVSVADSITALDETTLTNLMEFKIRNGLENLDIKSDYLQQAIFGERMDIPDDYWQSLADEINAKLAELGIEPIKIDVKTGEITQVAKATKEGWQDAARAVQAVGGALQQIENPSAKIAGIVGEAIANIALGFAQATSSSSKLGVFGWIAAIAGGIGTMISTISAIKSATAGSYAEGGIIPGHDYNDGLIANVSSGELILNRAQQGVLASQLAGSAPIIQIEGVISGEDIRLVQKNNNRRTGRGEYVTTKAR